MSTKKLLPLFVILLVAAKGFSQPYSVNVSVLKDTFFLNEPLEVRYEVGLPGIVKATEKFLTTDFRTIDRKGTTSDSVKAYTTSSSNKTYIDKSKPNNFMQVYFVRLLAKKPGSYSLPRIEVRFPDTVVLHAPGNIFISKKKMNEGDSLLWAFGSDELIDVLISEKGERVALVKEKFPKVIRLGVDTIRIQFSVVTKQPFSYAGFNQGNFRLKKKSREDKELNKFLNRTQTLDDLLKDAETVKINRYAISQATDNSNVYFLIPFKKGKTSINLGAVELSGKTYSLGEIAINVK